MEPILHYNLVKFTFLVVFPKELIQNAQRLAYFYCLNDREEKHEKPLMTNHFRSLDLKDVQSTIIDGMALFICDNLTSLGLKSIKMKVLRALIDLDSLWHSRIAVDFNKVIEQMNCIFECLCLKDLEYKNQFEKVFHRKS